jgi:enoyl-CoA hydratase
VAYECFEVERDAKVATIRLSRPQRLNAMTRDFWIELPAILRGLEAEGGTRAAVICSSGRHFSAGMDLSLFRDGAALETGSVGARERFRQQLKALQGSFEAIAGARFPVIAAVQGGCIGGAVDLVTACCLRYCAREAYFVIQEINLGMMADVGTLQRLPKQLPEAVVRELAYTGDRLGAERAERLGFVNGVFDSHEALVEGAHAVARRIAAKAPAAIAASKDMIGYSRDHSVAESFAYLNALQPGVFDIDAVARAAAAGKDGPAPQFEDLPAIDPPIKP